jgi:hypothetical protein
MATFSARIEIRPAVIVSRFVHGSCNNCVKKHLAFFCHSELAVWPLLIELQTYDRIYGYTAHLPAETRCVPGNGVAPKSVQNELRSIYSP